MSSSANESTYILQTMEANVPMENTGAVSKKKQKQQPTPASMAEVKNCLAV